jgi:DNA invertase Pin-like site-specific DNA recombinase
MATAPQNSSDVRDCSKHLQDGPIPRRKRQRRRDRVDRGLPPDKDLRDLASEYLTVQTKHWPKLVQAGLLPTIDDAVIDAMVEDFKLRHRTGQVDPEPLRRLLKYCLKLAGDYSRYSCDNSNPKSIIDQMVKALEKARQEDRFVPWQYVFADYSVSGLNTSRQGYASYKAVLQEKNHYIETTYIDDFTRASRDEVEWWKLAHLSRRLQKRMIGASDGFDLFAPNWDMMLSVYALLSRLFIKGLREKVKRGLRGAARRGGSLGVPSLGFTRTARRDEHGNIVCDRDGLPQHVPCIDPSTREDRKMLYELYVEKCWSPYRITKHFNALKVDGWDGWTELTIKRLLWSPTAIGMFIWNKTRREYNYEEQKWEDATAKVFQLHPKYGDPTTGEGHDRPLPPELKRRIMDYVERQYRADRNRFGERLRSETSFNALVRNEIRAGNL